VKIVHLLASPFFSGPAQAVAELALAQRRLGHAVTVAVDRTRAEAPAEELAAPRVDALGLGGLAELALSVKSPPWTVLRDVARLRRVEADVVHAHFSHDHLVARLGRPSGAVLVRSVHAPRSLRWSTPSADAWTVPTAELARGLLGRPALVLPPLVGASFVPPLDRAAARRALGLAEAPTFGMVSTFKPSRRHALGLEAFARLRQRRPDARLVLIGDGALEGELRGLVARLGLDDAVRFAGYQAGAQFVAWLQTLDEVWVLGLGNDFGGRAAAQARACGARVVAVDEGALSRYADVVVAPAPDAVVEAALAGERRAVGIEAVDAVAQRVLALYGQARAA
jgi:glycosyltransferase involved in cell wall biosynthesis